MSVRRAGPAVGEGGRRGRVRSSSETTASGPTPPAASNALYTANKTPEVATLDRDLTRLQLGPGGVVHTSSTTVPTDLGADDITLDQLRKNLSLQRAVDFKFPQLSTSVGKPAQKGKKTFLSPETFATDTSPVDSPSPSLADFRQ
ncbi:hypothetical protein Bbelb_095630 [Branchiostoma belcheri]|nr:hypothetical protein Bbelb_095630 [Branchiostoma belcheri]